MLDEFDEDLLEITVAAKEFFSRCREGARKVDFTRDFGTFFILLRDRLEKEEKVLFPEYERISDQSR